MKKSAIVLSVMLSWQLNAAENVEVVQEGSWSWGMSATTTSLKDEVKMEGIDTSAFGFTLHADYLKSDWITSLSLEYMSYDDNAKFSQEVVGSGIFNDGDRSTKSSNASGVLFSAATGKAFYFGEQEDVIVYGQGGFDVMLNSERSIENCDNCMSQDIDVDGGLFVKVGAQKNTGSFNLGVFVKQYLTSDSISTTFGISASTSF